MDHTIVLAVEQFAQRAKANAAHKETFPINANGFDEAKVKAMVAEKIPAATVSRSGNYLTLSAAKT